MFVAILPFKSITYTFDMSKKPGRPKKPLLDLNALRNQLGASNLIDEMVKLITILSTGYAPQYHKPSPNQGWTDIAQGRRPLPLVEWRELTKEDVARYSLLLKTISSALGKILPDLRSVELNDISTPSGALPPEELAQKLMGVLGARPTSTPVLDPLTGRPQPAQPAPVDKEKAPWLQ